LNIFLPQDVGHKVIRYYISSISSTNCSTYYLLFWNVLCFLLELFFHKKKDFSYNVFEMHGIYTTHLGFYNWLIKWLLSFFTIIVTTSSCYWLCSYKGHFNATCQYGFVIVVNITTWWSLHKYQRFKYVYF
jgi:hypothetical protein